VLVAACATASSVAQTGVSGSIVQQDEAAAARADKNLPDAPSTQLSLQDEKLARDPGSKFTLTLSTTPGPGVPIELPTSGPLKLSLDDAIALGLERNVHLKYDRANQKAVRGYVGNLRQALIPNLHVAGSSSAQQINLAAMGFKPSEIANFGLNPADFPTIVHVNVTQAQFSASQTLFNLTDLELWRASKNEIRVMDLQTLNTEGDVVQAVATQYLRVLADEANLTNTQAEEVDAKTTFDQASQKLQAGVGIRLDALRGQVEYQQRQQQVAAAEGTLLKDLIQLNRIMGLPAGQELQLTDVVPYSDLDNMDLDRAKDTAFRHRKDYLGLEEQLVLASRELRAVKYQRLPTLAFSGFYGVIGQTTGSYHGDFVAQGTLEFPIFHEATQRGQEQSIDSQLIGLRQREQDLRVAIDGQIRSSMLDVTASKELVSVARSNVTLAEQELSDERDRFKAGVDDNLPVVDAEATLAGANSQLVQAMYQYNVAKLMLARNSGVVETRYRNYLGTN
jgi:outer membrane protein TolC